MAMAEWTPERLAAARDRCAHATLGPWSNPPRDEDGVIWIESLTEGRPVCTLDRREDATWISHARADLPDALAEIARLTDRLAAAEAVVEAARARNERLILWSHEDMVLREALYAHDATKGAPDA